MVKHLYIDPEESALWDFFDEMIMDDQARYSELRQLKSKKKKKECTKEKVASCDIRIKFTLVAKKRSTKPEKTVIISN